MLEEKRMNDSNDTENILRYSPLFSKGYGYIAKALAEDARPGMTIEAKGIYSFIASYAGIGLTAFPSVSLTCKLLQISESRYYKHRAALIKYNYITIEREKTGNIYGKNIYTMVLEPNESSVQTKKDSDSAKVGQARKEEGLSKQSNKENEEHWTKGELEIQLDASSLNEALKLKIKEWFEYKNERDEKPLYKSVIKALLLECQKNQADYGAQAVIDLIQKCISCGWKNIRFADLKNAAPKKEQKSNAPKVIAPSESVRHQNYEYALSDPSFLEVLSRERALMYELALAESEKTDLGRIRALEGEIEKVKQSKKEALKELGLTLEDITYD